jgi:hypothetical protein
VTPAALKSPLRTTTMVVATKSTTAPSPPSVKSNSPTMSSANPTQTLSNGARPTSTFPLPTRLATLSLSTGFGNGLLLPGLECTLLAKTSTILRALRLRLWARLAMLLLFTPLLSRMPSLWLLVISSLELLLLLALSILLLMEVLLLLLLGLVLLSPRPHLLLHPLLRQLLRRLLFLPLPPTPPQVSPPTSPSPSHSSHSLTHPPPLQDLPTTPPTLFPPNPLEVHPLELTLLALHLPPPSSALLPQPQTFHLCLLSSQSPSQTL